MRSIFLVDEWGGVVGEGGGGRENDKIGRVTKRGGGGSATCREKSLGANMKKRGRWSFFKAG